ncbi:MAG: carbohydrate ABC transporter permease [Lachnospiraceae bacterium]|jgi:putative aldouronate transport system permease protein|nr:carbohydrate ABC transporter permease [Lachnospiraceae bacterium]
MTGSKRRKRIKPFQILNILIMLFLIFITVYPMYYVVVASFSDPLLIRSHTGPLFSILGTPTLQGYQKTLSNKSLFTGFRNTLFYLFVGTFLQLFLTSLAAYVLSRKNFMIRKGVMKMFIFTMFFNGGLIPMFFAIRNTGVYNTIWVSSIPYAISAYNMIIMRTFFETIPESLEEAAIIDGANDFTVFSKVILPLSKPIIAVMVLYYGVGQWNSWFPAAMFTRDRKLYPLQMILREILIENQTQSADNLTAAMEDTFTKELVKYCTIVVSTFPILAIYPFLQKYFEKGVMIGAVKG